MNAFYLLPLPLVLVSCVKTTPSREASRLETSSVHFPRAFADGRKILFRSMTQLSGDDSITSGYGTTGADAVHHFSFILDDNSLTAVDFVSKETLFRFKVLASDDATITVDFNQAFLQFEADDVERDADGKAVLNSFGYPNVLTKTYQAIPGSLHLREQTFEGAQLISLDLKLQAPGGDQYSQAGAVSRIDYSFSPAQPDPAFPILKITDPLAQAQFFVDENSGIANRVNPGRSMVLHMEEGSPAAIKAGVEAGMAYWNKIFGKTIFSFAEDQKKFDNFYAQNIVRVIQTEIMGAGSIAQSDPETGSILLPGYELQFPHEFFDELKNTPAADTLFSWKAAFVTAHELGHVLGLQHNFAGNSDPTCASVMCYTANDLTMGNLIISGILDLDYDKQAIDYLYRSGKILPKPFTADPRN